MTPEQRAAYSAAQAVLSGTADLAQVANTFGLPLDTPREGLYPALMDLATPPATVMAFKPRPPRPEPTASGAGAAVDPQAAAARAERQAADRKRNNLSTLRSYRLKG